MVYLPHWPKPVGHLENELSLARMQEVLARLGDPHKKLPPTIHAAGTNGKGSTLAFLRAILESDGKIVHSYNTPHLINFNERIILAGKEISDEYLFEIIEEVRLKSEGLPLGFFEATTAAAFLAFSRIKADYLLLETGMGGRLDATNIIPNKLLTIITTISKDHVEFLGSDLRGIAMEKLAINKPGIPCISSLQHEQVAETIETYCQQNQIPLLAFGYDFGIEKTDNGFKYLSDKMQLELPEPSLAGDHQYINAASAITAFLEIKIKDQGAHPAPPIGVRARVLPEQNTQNEQARRLADIISSGLKNTRWPSRLEKIERPYIPKDWEFWLDGAHNPAGAFALASHLDYWRDKPVYLIFGTTSGREVKDFLINFQGKIAHLCLVKIKFEPASYEASSMLGAVKDLGFDVSTHDDLKEAVKYLHQLNNQPARILACGSLFMRGDI